MASNPLAGVWNLEIDTINTMGQKLADIESSGYSRRLPIIHFGFIQLDEHLGYVAGGLSRVYFGKIKKTPVAVKILFAMELTPQVVEAFYNEVQILYSLQHPNVITCLGISVMPPAVCVILEHCRHGSLFDYLYKPIPSTVDGIQSTKNRSFDQSATELSTLPRKVEYSTDGAHKGGQKRPSRQSNPDDYAVAQKRTSRTLDEILAKKRGSRPPDDISAASAATPRINSPSVDTKMTDDVYSTNNPIQHGVETSTGSEVPHGNGEDRVSGADHPTESYKKSGFLERASSVVDNIFGKTPTDRASLSIDPERYSISQNDRLKFLIDGRTHVHSTQESTDLRHSTSSNISSHSVAGNHAKPLFSIHKQKMKQAELRILNWEEKFEMIVGACRGLSFLHERGYMHCDLKSPNFLVSDVRC